MDVIDGFAHAMPKATFEELLDEFPAHPDLLRFGDGSFLYDVEEHHIPDMDEYGIDKQVLALASPSPWKFDGMTADRAFPIVRRANTRLRELVDDHPDRFIAVGTIPFVDEDFLTEFDRCIQDLDMAGIQIFSNFDGKPLDHEEVRPIYEKAEAYDVPLWLHPTFSDWLPGMNYIERAVFGFPFDTGIALSRLVMGGVMERHPDLKVIPHHGGGVIPHFDGRLESIFQRPDHYQHDPDEFSKPVLEYYRSFYADAVLNGSVHSLACCVDFYGSDHVVFGTDYPYGPNDGRRFMRENIRAVEDLDVSETERDGILGGNLRSLIEG